MLQLVGFSTMKLFFLVCKESLERLLHFSSNDGNECYQINSLIHQLFAERNDHDDFLEMHFNHSLSKKCRAKECPEWHQEVAASYASEIKQWIGNLKFLRDFNEFFCNKITRVSTYTCTCQNTQESNTFDDFLHPQFQFFE